MALDPSATASPSSHKRRRRQRRSEHRVLYLRMPPALGDRLTGAVRLASQEKGRPFSTSEVATLLLTHALDDLDEARAERRGGAS